MVFWLREAFGAAAVEEIAPITRGPGSDLVLRIVAPGAPYLPSIMTRIDERMDPDRIFACLRGAAEAGIAPAIRYSNAEGGISITDFVEVVPFAVARARSFRRRCGGRMRRRRFPRRSITSRRTTGSWRLRKAGLLPQDEIEEVFARYEQVCTVHARIDSDLVSRHMDLKPENALFERDGRAGGAAFVNDRYFDLAWAANFASAEEGEFLERYIGDRPDEYRRAA